MSQYKIRTKTISGHELTEKTWGGGSKTILLIHGIGVSSEYFAPLAAELQGEYRVIALDLPGYGMTPQPDHDLSINELADVVNEYVRTRDIKRCIIAGHSMGTQTVTQAIRDAPNLYEKAVLMAPTINKKERHILTQAWRLFQDTLREPGPLNYIVFRDYLRMGMMSYLRTSRSMFKDAIEKDVQAVSKPLLILHGERDPIVPKKWAEYLAAQARRGSLKIVPGQPHNFQYTAPKETARLCSAFIDD